MVTKGHIFFVHSSILLLLYTIKGQQCLFLYMAASYQVHLTPNRHGDHPCIVYVVLTNLSFFAWCRTAYFQHCRHSISHIVPMSNKQQKWVCKTKLHHITETFLDWPSPILVSTLTEEFMRTNCTCFYKGTVTNNVFNNSWSSDVFWCGILIFNIPTVKLKKKKNPLQ